MSQFWVRPRGGGCQPPPLTTTEQCRVAGRSPPCWSLRRRRAGGPCPRGGTVLPCTLVPEVSRGAFSFPVALCVPRSGLAGSDGDAGSRRSGLCQGPSPQQPARLACALANAQVIEARAAASVAGTPHVCVILQGVGTEGSSLGTTRPASHRQCVILRDVGRGGNAEGFPRRDGFHRRPLHAASGLRCSHRSPPRKDTHQLWECGGQARAWSHSSRVTPRVLSREVRQRQVTPPTGRVLRSCPRDLHGTAMVPAAPAAAASSPLGGVTFP